MSAVKSYFDTHSHNHSYQKDPNFYNELVKRIRDNNSNKNLKILDVGCGGGSFIKSMIDAGIDADFVGVDVSTGMLSMAKETLSKYHDRVELIAIDGFDITSKINKKFDIIHMDSVLHHLIASTQGKSMQLVHKMLSLLISLLENKGQLIIEEVYYNSFLYPKLTSKIIFYGLKILNSLKLDVSKWFPDIQLGLEVNFMHESELEKLLSKYSEKLIIFKNDSWKVPRTYKYFLLKNFGHISYIAQI